MGQIRQVLRYHHYAYSTEKAYCDWVLRYIKHFGAKIHPIKTGKMESEDGVNISILRELMGQADLKTTEINTHVM